MRALVTALLAGAALWGSPAATRACSSSGGELRVTHAPGVRDGVPIDGPITIGALFGSDRIEDTRDQIYAVLTLDGHELPHTLELLDLSSSPHPEANYWRRPAIFIIQPTSPLLPLTTYQLDLYLVDLEYQEAGYGDRRLGSLSLTTRDGPASAPSLTESTAIHELRRVEVLDSVCCDRGWTSCGPEIHCVAVQYRWAPSVSLSVAIATEDEQLAVPWVARVDDQGTILERYYTSSARWTYLQPDIELSPYGMWTDVAIDLELRPGSGVQCFASGITDLRTMTDTLQPPYCVDTDSDDLPRGKVDAWQWPENLNSSNCEGPWVRASTGRFGDQGCRLVTIPRDPRSSLWLLLLLARRRRDPPA